MLRSAIITASVAALMALGAGSSGQAAVILTGANTVSIPGVATFQTDGSEMSGLSVTAQFADGFSETVAWQSTGGTTGAAIGTGWRINVFGDTFLDFAWEVLNFRLTPAGGPIGLTGLFLDGAPGLTIFDRTAPSPGTPDSSAGNDFLTNLVDDAFVVATYDFQVQIGADPPVGDEWQTLNIDFSAVSNGAGALERVFLFTQDTDNDARRIRTPEPASLGLLGLGSLVGWALLRRRRA
jgi:hypothetical protein